MLTQFKRIALFSLCLFLGLSLSAQYEDTTIISQTDSLQDLKIEKINQEISALKVLLKKSNEDFIVLHDSLNTMYKEQSEKDMRLQGVDESLIANDIDLQQQLSFNFNQTQQDIEFYKRYFLFVVPVLLLIMGVIFILLSRMIGRERRDTDKKMNALRKYTYEGIEETREDYLNEIKRRVKKLAIKMKGSGKRKKSKVSRDKARKSKKKK